MSCPVCGDPVQPGDAFCESCGASLVAPVRRQRCPSCCGEISEDGWCTVCGSPAPTGRDHVTQLAPPNVSGVSDKGRVHSRNDDAFALAADGPWAALIVCDGVTSTTDSDVASLAAARAACDLLASAPKATGLAAGRQEYWSQQLRAAALAANKAAAAAAIPGAADPAACTFAAAVIDEQMIVASWLGDSRVYWLPDEGKADQLTADHSLAAERSAADGPRAVAETEPQWHAITRWLGADATELDAPIACTIAACPGWLLVCSDGLWNYCPAAADLRALVGAQPPEPLRCVEALVAWANAQGGHDNITAILARIAPVSTSEERPNDRTRSL